MRPLVSIIMGSTSDYPVMEKAAKFFEETKYETQESQNKGTTLFERNKITTKLKKFLSRRG